jgi:hypothetical protein
MPSGLISVAVAKKNGNTYSKTLLLACDRILDMKNNSSGKAEFYYDDYADDLKGRPTLYTASTWSVGSIHAAIERADTSTTRFWCNVLYSTRVPGGRQQTIDAMWKLFNDQILHGYDNSDGTTSYIWIQRGSDILRLKTSHLIADLIAAGSKSRSLSRSAL